MFPIEIYDNNGKLYVVSLYNSTTFNFWLPHLNSYYIRSFKECWELENSNIDIASGYYQTPPEVRAVIDRLLENRAFW